MLGMNQVGTLTWRVRSDGFAEGVTGMTDEGLLKRFVGRRDEAAFEALVQMHGPMVLGVCRRVLGNYHDAEDAFQATFLVFARKADSIAESSLVGCWLYGVAFRTARKAKAMIAKKRARERPMHEIIEPEAVTKDLWGELCPLLDQELNGMPDKYRLPVLLCDLEGKTHREAAQYLGWPEGTLSVRLMRGRTKLAERLTRRGVVISVTALGLSLSHGAASAAVPSELLKVSTIRTASLFASGQTVPAGMVSANVAALTKGVLNSMLVTKLAKIAVGLTMIAAVGIGVKFSVHQMEAAEPAQAEVEKPQLAQSEPETGEKKNADVESARSEPNKQEADMSDLDKLQGKWKLTASERKGRKFTTEEVNNRMARLTVSGEKFTFAGVSDKGNETYKGKIRINPVQQPKTLDWYEMTSDKETPLGNNSVPSFLGIYRLEGDTLTCCFADPAEGKVRPEDFTTNPNPANPTRSGVFMFTFKLEKP